MAYDSVGNAHRGGTAIGLGLAAVLALSMEATPALGQQPFVPQAGAGATMDVPQASITLRPEMFVVGASSMKGYVETTGKHLRDEYDVPAPKVSLLGTSPGIQEFCGGLGPQYPDIVAAYRGMHKSEFDRCVENGVLDIIEVKIGLSALYVVIKKNDTPFDMTPRMFYNAFAAQIPVDGEFTDNPNKSWRDVNRLAPDLPIRMIVPGKASGTRFVFDNMIMQAGCRRVKEVDRIFAAIDRVPKCINLRNDHVGATAPPAMRMDARGVMQVVPEQPVQEFDLVVTEVEEPYGDKMMELLTRSPPGTIAIMAGEVFDAHYDEFQPMPIGGYLPVDGAIERFDYDIATPNFFYFKRGHMRDNAGRGVVRGIREFMQKLTSEELMGRDGIFVRSYGLVPLNRAAIETERRKVQTLKRFVR